MTKWGEKIALLVGCVALAGCSNLPGLEGLLPGPQQAVSQAQTEITVTQSAVSLTAPNGFCVDPVSTRDAASEAFVVFGNCAAITGDTSQAQPSVNAIVTATVSSVGLASNAAIAPQSEALVGFFQSNAGKRALSRNADPGAVRIGDGFAEDGAVFLLVADSSPIHFKGAMKSYWRSYFDAGAAVVAMSVIGFEENPISGSEGLTLLRRFKERNARTPSVTPLRGIASGSRSERPVERPS
ncbi:MAG: hypothetical protein AAF700_04420 [Pseudomonadota bacterium]